MIVPDLDQYPDFDNVELPVISIGFISMEHDFPMGDLPEFSVQALECIVSEFPEGLKACGSHPCNYPGCSHVTGYSSKHYIDDNLFYLGSATFFIPSHTEDFYYICPDLILHYCVLHRYLPPQGFIESLEIYQFKVSQGVYHQNACALPSSLYKG